MASSTERPAGAAPVTLAMVSYNKADVVGLVIESAMRGSLPPDRIVVADDGSSDATADAAEAACAKAGVDYRIIRHPRLGPYRLQTMRNTAVAAALDGVVLLSDSDCILAPSTLRAHQAIHATFPMAVGTGTRFEYLAGTSGRFTSMYSTLEFAHSGRANYMVPYGANMSFSKELWRRLAGFDRAYEGRYGFDDHEFILRGEQIGAVVYSDPAAFVFHCPHDTIFGNRDSGSNAWLFERTFNISYGYEQSKFIRHVVAPGYWRGERRTSLLGSDSVVLDRWGAPDGYEPAPHLALTESQVSVVARVRSLLSTYSATDLQFLRDLARKLDVSRMLPHSPGEILMGNLKWIFGEFGRPEAVDRQRLDYWLNRWLRWSDNLSLHTSLEGTSTNRIPVATK